ncbi:hypothetical protein FA13DRAFT_1723702 [Coprinellus micaceus]|uniref:Uncharacterized protein n=1 Tax=Coprinellus micaceus TaxID=71717 RepID=A0A4Y7TZA1_COPMI|nr:hypothetical protein FA13DRAFT_1723702 [Coprinellus micaceus]
MTNITLYGYSLSSAALRPSSRHPRLVARLFPLHDRPFTPLLHCDKALDACALAGDITVRPWPGFMGDVTVSLKCWPILFRGCLRPLLSQPISSLLQPHLKHAMAIGLHQPPIRSFTSALTSASARRLDINVPSNRRQEDSMVCHASPGTYSARAPLTSYSRCLP